MKKDFITDRLGMYAFPDNNIVLKGDVSSTPVTKKYLNQGTTIFTTADGTTGVLPNGQDVTLPSNTVLEMQYAQMGAQVDPQQQQQQQLMQLISMYCQVVGGGDQSCAQKVAKSLEKNPEKMVQQMVAAVQQAQQQQQPEEGEEQMARDGGCIDCQEQFPQAQNLNWFYKAGGGEAFYAANQYPEDWSSYHGNQYAGGGGIRAVGAQTYLPYDRPGETRLNGMFQKGGEEYGGQADLESIYRVMKAGGLNMNPRKKKASEETFDQYMMRMGGLPKHQAQQSQVGTGLTLPGYGLPEVTIQGQAPQGVTMSPGLLQNIQTYGLPPGTTTINYPTGFQQWQAGQPGYTAPAYVPPTGSWRNPVGTINTNVQLPNVNRQASFAEQNPQAMTRIQQPQQTAGPAAGNARAQQQAAAQQAAAQQATTSSAPAGTTGARSRTAAAQWNQEMMTMAPMLGIQPVDIGFPDIQQPQSPQQPQYSPSPGASSRSIVNQRPATQVTGSMGNKYMSSMVRGYKKGFGVTRLLGSKAGALYGLAGAAGSFADMFRGGKDKFKYTDDSGTKIKLKGQEARDAAMKYFDDIYPPQNTKEYGGMYYQPGGEYGMFTSAEDQREKERINAYSRSGRLAGFADAAEINRLEELEEERKRRSGISGLNAPSITGATKTPGGGPQGSLNQPGFVPQTTVGNFPSGMYPLSPLSNQGLPAAQTGGSILDYFEDGGTYDLDDMTPDEREDLIRRIYAAGGSVEFI